jgi:hypothetical protein
MCKFHHKSFLEACVPIEKAKRIIEKAKKDPEIVFDMSLISMKINLYRSPKIEENWKRKGYFSLTRYKPMAKITDFSKKNKFIDDFCTYSVHLGAIESMEDVEFTQWDKWLEEGLCCLFIAEKDFCQEMKSLPQRVLDYIK